MPPESIGTIELIVLHDLDVEDPNDNCMVCRNSSCGKIITDPDEIITQIDGLIEMDFIERNRGSHRYIKCSDLQKKMVDEPVEMKGIITSENKVPEDEIPIEQKSYEEKTELELIKEWQEAFHQRIFDLQNQKNLSKTGAESLTGLEEWLKSIITVMEH